MINFLSWLGSKYYHSFYNTLGTSNLKNQVIMSVVLKSAKCTWRHFKGGGFHIILEGKISLKLLFILRQPNPHFGYNLPLLSIVAFFVHFTSQDHPFEEKFTGPPSALCNFHGCGMQLTR